MPVLTKQCLGDVLKQLTYLKTKDLQISFKDKSLFRKKTVMSTYIFVRTGSIFPVQTSFDLFHS